MQNLNATDLGHTTFARRLADAETDFDKRAALAQTLPDPDLAHFAREDEMHAAVLGLARYELDELLRIIARLDEKITDQRERIESLEAQQEEAGEVAAR